MGGDIERVRLAMTFNSVADRYHRARPEYPQEVYERLLNVTGLRPPARLLEVGCATGKATLPLARIGFHILCVEPGPALAAVARANLVGSRVQVRETRFEDLEPPETKFDLVYAATAWHWIDPELRYVKAAAMLRQRGWLAFWDAFHVIPYDGDRFFEELQEVYDEIGEALPPNEPMPRPQELPEQRDEIHASGLFELVDVWQFDWELTYDADRYIDLLNTFSGHIAMQGWQRDRLYGEVRRRLLARADGLVRRHWGGVLHIARRAC